jgi:hypothetical protein
MVGAYFLYQFDKGWLRERLITELGEGRKMVYMRPTIFLIEGGLYSVIALPIWCLLFVLIRHGLRRV